MTSGHGFDRRAESSETQKRRVVPCRVPHVEGKPTTDEPGDKHSSCKASCQHGKAQTPRTGEEPVRHSQSRHVRNPDTPAHHGGKLHGPRNLKSGPNSLDTEENKTLSPQAGVWYVRCVVTGSSGITLTLRPHGGTGT